LIKEAADTVVQMFDWGDRFLAQLVVVGDIKRGRKYGAPTRRPWICFSRITGRVIFESYRT
jgi:hypothetical protein